MDSHWTVGRDRRMWPNCRAMDSDVARACDEALGIDTSRIRSGERDQRMWAELQGDG